MTPMTTQPDELGAAHCSGLACTTHRLQMENAQRRVIQKNTIADLLITHDIIHALSIEDAEGYDNFETSDNVMRFTLALESLLFPNTKLCRRVGRRKATMKPETQQPHPVGSSAWFGLVRSARAKCPKCGKKGMGYAGHPHAFGYKDYTRLLCRYCHARFKTPDERPNEKVSASGGENQKPK